MILKIKLFYFTDDTTLYAEVASPSEYTNVANSTNSELDKIQSFSTWGMKLYHLITISRSRNHYPPHHPLTLCGNDLGVSNSLKILGIKIDYKLTL